MEKILKFNESWFKTKKVPSRSEYDNQFKKSFSDRSKAERIITESLYYLEETNVMPERFLGAIESALVIEGFFKGGEPFKYNKSVYKFLGIFPISVEETHMSYIIRNAKEYLKNNNVL